MVIASCVHLTSSIFRIQFLMFSKDLSLVMSYTSIMPWKITQHTAQSPTLVNMPCVGVWVWVWVWVCVGLWGVCDGGVLVVGGVGVGVCESWGLCFPCISLCVNINCYIIHKCM